ncbi:MAG: S41 family peptidase [Candidatus Hydrogenedentota bacterium]|nr:MAG: S41 family peptidase [Candidatus Hydrogenedentota bacterium]
MERNRNEFVFFLLSVLLLGLIIGNSLSGYVAAQTGSTYEDLEIFSDALSIVQSEYVEEVSTENLIYGALKGMLDKLDAHSQFMPPDIYRELKVETEGHFGGLGIVISLDKNKVLTVVSPIEDTPAFKAGVQAGDKIIEIDGVGTEGLVLEEAVKKLRGPKGSKVTITVLRLREDDGGVPEELEFTLIRDDIKIPSVKWKMLDDNIGYIRLVEFSERSGRDLHKAITELRDQEMRSLIIDFRNNPGGLLNVAADVADEFLEKGRLIVYTESRNSKQNLRFKAKQDAAVEPDTPIVVLVNGGSASASEIVAGALKDWHRAVILGENTFGKGSVQSIIPLSDGSALRLTTAKYLTPKGHSINGLGIAPDIEVKMSKEQLIHLLGDLHMPTEGEEDEDEGKDAIRDIQLQRAVELLKGYDIFKTLEENVSIAKKQIEPASEEVAEETGPATPTDETILDPIPEIMVPDGEETLQPEEIPGG